MKVWPLATAAVCAVLLAGSGEAERIASSSSRTEPASFRGGGAERALVKMGLVLNALDNPFFVAIYAGARAEATALKVRLTVRSVTSNADLAGQAAQVQALVAEMDECYAVNPITASNLVSALRGVRHPVVNLDSPIAPTAAKRAGVRIHTYIGTDDFAAGRLAGSRMASLLRRGGDVALIGGLVHNVNSGVRLDGFEAGIQGSGVRVVAQANADYDRTKAEIATNRILRAHPGISGFFAASDLMALGIADAVRAAGKSGRIKVVGLDGIAEALVAIQAGSIDATVSQYPYIMGQLAVQACAAAARGAKLPPRVDAPIALLTKDNVARAIAAFPVPVQRYSDPFSRLLLRRG